MSEQTYYEGSDYGDYGYVTLEQIVNDYMASKQPDDYDAMSPRYLVINHARWGLRDLYFDALREIKAIELDLGPNLAVVLPPDYVDYVRISWVDEYGTMYPMAENNTLSISKVYLQDSDYNILFDIDGNILEGTPATQTLLNIDGEGIREYNICGPGFTPNIDRSKVYENGSYRIDKEAGLIRFDSTVYTKSVVLEYVSDGLYFDPVKGEDETKARVHKYAEQALRNYIYWKLIEKKRHVPRYEKLAARKEYFNSKRIAKRRINQGSVAELLQSVRGGDVWNPLS